MPTSTRQPVESPRRIQRFEDLIGWQKARELVQEIYSATRSGPIARDWAFTSQLQRSAVSVMSNIAEGFERNHRREFFQFLGTAKGSLAEVRSLLYIARDISHISPTQFTSLMSKADELAKVIGGLRAAVERKLNTSTTKS